MTSRYLANPGIFCDKCEEPCRPHFVNQCPQCGGYFCRNCFFVHPCKVFSPAVVRWILPEYVDYSIHLNSRKGEFVTE